MSEREPLPTKAQIYAITDLEAVLGIKDEVERRIDKIETDLEFLDGDDDWRSRACNALALHRYTNRMLARRLDQLKEDAPKSAATRPEEDIHPLTIEGLANRDEVDLAALSTVEQVDEKTAWIAAIIDAMTRDREEEISLPANERDEAFMAATGNALRHFKRQRQLVQDRRGQISKAARAAEAAARDATRERLFIDAARAVLGKEDFLRIWDRVEMMARLESS